MGAPVELIAGIGREGHLGEEGPRGESWNRRVKKRGKIDFHIHGGHLNCSVQLKFDKRRVSVEGKR